MPACRVGGRKARHRLSVKGERRKVDLSPRRRTAVDPGRENRGRRTEGEGQGREKGRRVGVVGSGMKWNEEGRSTDLSLSCREMATSGFIGVAPRKIRSNGGEMPLLCPISG